MGKDKADKNPRKRLRENGSQTDEDDEHVCVGGVMSARLEEMNTKLDQVLTGPSTKSGLDRFGRIELRIGSDWYFRFWCRRIILRKAVLVVTQVALNKKSEFSQQLGV